MDVNEANVALTALNAADIASVEITGQSQIFLREALPSAEFSNTPTEFRLHRLVTFVSHATIEPFMATLSPRTLRTGITTARRNHTDL